MRCPKCGYHSFDHLDSCKKCGKELAEFKARFGIRSVLFPGQAGMPITAAEEAPSEVAAVSTAVAEAPVDDFGGQEGGEGDDFGFDFMGDSEESEDLSFDELFEEVPPEDEMEETLPAPEQAAAEPAAEEEQGSDFEFDLSDDESPTEPAAGAEATSEDDFGFDLDEESGEDLTATDEFSADEFELPPADEEDFALEEEVDFGDFSDEESDTEKTGSKEDPSDPFDFSESLTEQGTPMTTEPNQTLETFPAEPSAESPLTESPVCPESDSGPRATTAPAELEPETELPAETSAADVAQETELLTDPDADAVETPAIPQEIGTETTELFDLSVEETAEGTTDGADEPLPLFSDSQKGQEPELAAWADEPPAETYFDLSAEAEHTEEESPSPLESEANAAELPKSEPLALASAEKSLPVDSLTDSVPEQEEPEVATADAPAAEDHFDFAAGQENITEEEPPLLSGKAAAQQAKEPSPLPPEPVEAETPDSLSPILPPLENRIGAFCCDLLLLALVGFCFIIAAEAAMSGGGETLVPSLATLIDLSIPYFLVLFSLAFGYFTLFHFLAGQTPGKMLAGLRVETLAGEPLLFSQAFMRSVGGLLQALPAGLGYLVILFSTDRRGWNDRLAGTRLVNLKGLPEEG